MSDAPAFIAAATKEIGYTEQPPGSNRTKFASEAGHANGYSWCASFVVAIARRCAIKLPSESAYTPTMATAFQRAGAWSRDPAPGDLVFFDFPDSVHRIQHVGIVTFVHADGSITTIEGNTSSGDSGSQSNGGGVFRRHRNRTYCVGFGRPAFSSPVPIPAPAPPWRDEVLICFRDATDGKVWLVENGKRRHIDRPELDAYAMCGVIHVDAKGEPVKLDEAHAAVMYFRHPEG